MASKLKLTLTLLVLFLSNSFYANAADDDDEGEEDDEPKVSPMSKFSSVVKGMAKKNPLAKKASKPVVEAPVVQAPVATVTNTTSQAGSLSEGIVHSNATAVTTASPAPPTNNTGTATPAGGLSGITANVTPLGTTYTMSLSELVSLVRKVMAEEQAAGKVTTVAPPTTAQPTTTTTEKTGSLSAKLTKLAKLKGRKKGRKGRGKKNRGDEDEDDATTTTTEAPKAVDPEESDD